MHGQKIKSSNYTVVNSISVKGVKEIDKSSSYSSSNVYPSKVLKLKDTCVSPLGVISPVHLQVCPTNTCNLNCSFCSCSKREKGQVLEIQELVKTLTLFKELGTKAVTITGGGEPCCYSDLPELLNTLSDLEIESGMVSNGILLNNFKSSLPLLTWCRISASDDRNINQLLGILKEIIPFVKIDWAISYVLTAKFNIKKLIQVIEFANLYELTHVRLVSDLLNLDNLENMDNIKTQLKEAGVNDKIVLYQDRSTYKNGGKECRISLLKPVLAPDGWLYPCCGVQYALPEAEGLFPQQMRMCKIDEIRNYFSQQTMFNGSICSKCYYSSYNNVLKILTDSYEHGVFV